MKNRSNLENIEIIGLFGRDNYKFEFNEAVNIFVAENGSGKTTILNIINASLNGDLRALRKYNFRQINVVIDGHRYSILKDDIVSIRSLEFIESFLEYLKDEIPTTALMEIDETLKIKIPTTPDEFLNSCHGIMPSRYVDDYVKGMDLNSIFEIKSENEFIVLRKELNTSALYMTTYRRIEDGLENFKWIEERNTRRRRLRKPVRKTSKINFGMADVKLMIQNLLENMKDKAILSYSKMNAQILDDLLSDNITSDSSLSERTKPEKKAIDILIGRIGQEKITKISDLYKYIDSGDQDDNKNSDFLDYYLSRLMDIYDDQKVLDEELKRFITVCNKYLNGKDIVFDEVNLDVKIETLNSDIITLDQLSSGEKQIISIFAQLYLNLEKDIILLIDEPELSLSIFWQKTFLEDMYNSNKIALLIATTHSPFIFENDFVKFAKDIRKFWSMYDITS
ncbi:hypothetical protein CI105_08415 [Candidatus Izimaplasma bacterium ZiA1]|uniref:AAA family ATPase n=1 Tax=Candidatus Izimoplasma sp. ZiA1 TaxID=2024899 RepID=UPI000BAA95C8|nr:hypothetical protein CI105_08415 [Candidatus Izimaplasma bacterium ZiA1]